MERYDWIDIDGVRYVSSASAEISIAREYLLQLCHGGKIRAKRLGYQWYIDPRSLNDFLSVEDERRVGLQQASQEYASTTLLQHAIENMPPAYVGEDVTQRSAHFQVPNIVAGLLALVLTFGAATLFVSGAARGEVVAVAAAIDHAVSSPLTHSLTASADMAVGKEQASAKLSEEAVATSSATAVQIESAATSGTGTQPIPSTPSTAGASDYTSNSSPEQTISAAPLVRLSDPLAATQADLASSTAALDAMLQSDIAALPSDEPASSYITAPAWAASQAIDQLSGTTLSNVTVNGVTGLTASNIPSLAYLPLSGGTLTGALFVPTLSASSTNYNVLTATNASTTNFSNIGTAYFGGTATTTIDSAGDLAVGGSLTANGSVTLGNATSTTLFASLGNFTTGIVNSLTASIANIAGLTISDSTTTNATTTALYAAAGTIPILSTTWATLTNATSTNFFASNLTGDVEPLGGNTFLSLGSVLGRVISPTDFGAVGDTQREICTITTTSGQANLAVNGCSFASTDVGKYLVVFGVGARGAPITTTIVRYFDSQDIAMGAVAQTTLTRTAEEVTWGHDDSAAINAALVANATQGATNSSSCVSLPPAPEGYWGVASPINLDPNGLPSCLRGSGMYQSEILALTSMSEVAYKDTSYVYGGTVEDVGFDGNTIATDTVYLACAERMNFTNVLYANAGSDADLVVGDNVTPGCNTDQFNSNVVQNSASYYARTSALPLYDVFVNTTDSYFNDMECANASNSNFYVNSSAFNTYLTNVHCWNSGSPPNYNASYTFDINASAKLINPTVDGVNTVGVMINAPDVDIEGGSLINPASTTATMGVEIAPSLNNITVTGFDTEQSLGVQANDVSAELPLGNNVHIFANPGAYDYNLMAIVSPLSATSFSLGGGALKNISTTTVAGSDIAIGSDAGENVVTGALNVLIGSNAGINLSNGNSNVAVGYATLEGQSGSGTNNDVAVGYEAGKGNTNGVNDVFLGSNAGSADTSGSSNIFLGTSAASSTASGNYNIALGYNIALPSTNGSNQLDIGNLIFGTGVNGQGTSISSGNVGIGTTSPYSRLTVWGPDSAATTSAFSVVNNASTTVFAAYDNGNATYSGSIFQSSDQRLKTNVQSLDASSSLTEIESLNPVSYLRLDEPGTGENLGFIAQQVQQIFPQLVSTSTPTALTPDGTLTLNYEGLISPIVSAVKAVASISGDFESNLIAWLGNAQNGIQDLFAHNIYVTNELCIDNSAGTPVCITGDQLAAVLSASGTQDSPESVASSPATTSPESVTSNGAGESAATDTPPIIEISGDNPATVDVGTTYNDLGATITGPQADLNLGIEAIVDGGATTTPADIQIDTTQPGTHTIEYIATDQNGLKGSATRTVIVSAAPQTISDASPTAATSTDAADATSTDASR